MSIITPIPPQLPLYQRLFYNIPVLGWMARDVIYGDRDNVVWAGVIVAAVWLWGVAQWGVLLLLATFTVATGLLIAGAFYAWFAVQVARAEARARKATTRADKG